MRIAVSATSRHPSGDVDPRFGRAPFFLVLDSDTGTWEVLENRSAQNAAQGAGVEAAQRVSRAGAQAVLTGHCGPKAFQALSAAAIEVYTGLQGSVEEAVRQYQAGELSPSESADVNGHW